MYWTNNAQLAMSMHDYANPLSPMEIEHLQNSQNQLQNREYLSKNYTRNYYYFQPPEIHSYHDHAYRDVEYTYRVSYPYVPSMQKNALPEDLINALSETIPDGTYQRATREHSIASSHGLHYGSLSQGNSSMGSMTEITDNNESLWSNETRSSNDISKSTNSKDPDVQCSDFPSQNDSKSRKGFICNKQVSDFEVIMRRIA